MARPADQSAKWDYKVQQVRFKHPLTGEPCGVFANVREDTKQILGVTSDQYGLVQNEELMDIASSALDKLGMKGYEKKIIVTGGGAKVFAEFTFRDRTLATQKGDLFGYKLRIVNSFDRSLRAAAMLAFIRLACLNGMETAEREFSMDRKHSNKITAAFVEAAIEKALGRGSEALKVYQHLMDKEVTNDQGSLILKNLGLSDKLREEMEMLWLNPKRDLDKARNLYSLYNAATEFLTHKVETDRYEYANKLSHALLFKLVNAARSKEQFDRLILPVENPKTIVVATGPILD